MGGVFCGYCLLVLSSPLLTQTYPPPPHTHRYLYPKLDLLIDEQFLLGTSQLVHETLGDFTMAMSVELVHNARAELTYEQLVKVVHMLRR